jgi:hypothetical protein
MATIKRYVNGAWEEIPVAPEVTDVVKITPQELTDTEKEQARENIRAASIEDVNNLLAESRGTLGKAWLQSDISFPEFTSICSDGNMWVACSHYEDKAYYSNDGKTWSSVELGDGEGGMNCVYYADGVWLVGGYGTYADIWRSVDGINWTPVNIGPIEINDIYSDNGTWVAVGKQDYIFYSTDSTSWTQSDLMTNDFKTVSGVNFGTVKGYQGHWIALCESVYSQDDGHRTLFFTDDVSSFLGEGNLLLSGEYQSDFGRFETLNDVHYANGIWVVVGPEGIYYVAKTDDIYDYYSSWTKVTLNVPSGFNCIYNGNGLWVAGSIDNGIYHSTDGMTWTQTNIKTGTFLSLHYANGLWVAGSTNGTFFSEDGITWSQGAGLSGNVNDILFAGEDWIAAVGKGLYYSVPFSDDLQGVYDMAKGYADSLVPSVVNSSEYNFEVANNAEYRIEGASGLLMTGNNNKAHGFITFGGWIADGIEVLGFKASAGDDITQASAGETWEFSCDYGYIVWKNWGA